ncbi:MAG: PD-(D/E)XK nuclease family transposase [Lachnospiraceae bacterium]|nr:PD-(D/E)XK nuclease family transposase [Lachnospiraceae bacterium]
MANKLQQFFPSIRTREQVLKEIRSNPVLANKFNFFSEEQRENFLDICTGAKGVPILYDNIFQAVMNPDIYPDRVQDLIGCILGKKVVHISSLERSSFSLGDEKSLVILDLVVKLDDGSYIDLEVQKIGHAFPGQRAACYTSDLMIRQYATIKQEISRQEGTPSKPRFNYRMLRPVYTIVLIEKSGSEFHAFPNEYFHEFSPKSKTGLRLDLLTNQIFIPLDIFKQNIQNINKMSGLDEWLTFFCTDDPDAIIRLCENSPKFKPLYEHIYEICQNTERIMDMYSTILKKLDDYNVEYMIDDLQDQVASLNKDLDNANQRNEAVCKERDAAIEERDTAIEERDDFSKKLAASETKIKELEALLAAVSQK